MEEAKNEATSPVLERLPCVIPRHSTSLFCREGQNRSSLVSALVPRGARVAPARAMPSLTDRDSWGVSQRVDDSDSDSDSDGRFLSEIDNIAFGRPEDDEDANSLEILSRLDDLEVRVALYAAYQHSHDAHLRCPHSELRRPPCRRCKLILRRSSVG